MESGHAITYRGNITALNLAPVRAGSSYHHFFHALVGAEEREINGYHLFSLNFFFFLSSFWCLRQVLLLDVT